MTPKEIADAKFAELGRLLMPGMAEGTTQSGEMSPVNYNPTVTTPIAPELSAPPQTKIQPGMSQIRAWFQELLASYGRQYAGAQGIDPMPKPWDYPGVTGNNPLLQAATAPIIQGYTGASNVATSLDQLISPQINLMKQKYLPRGASGILEDLGGSMRKKIGF